MINESFKVINVLHLGYNDKSIFSSKMYNITIHIIDYANSGFYKLYFTEVIWLNRKNTIKL